MRRRLIEDRLAIDADQRRRCASEIMIKLSHFIDKLSGRSVGIHWPFRGEPDLRRWMESLAERGGCCALPIVIEKNAPLIFRIRRNDDKLASGVWNIPVPTDGGEVAPDIVIAPVAGYEKNCYRLGHGGGFFDRTLAAVSLRPVIIAVGYPQAAITGIHPLPREIPMTVSVTEHGDNLPAVSPTRHTTEDPPRAIR